MEELKEFRIAFQRMQGTSVQYVNIKDYSAKAARNQIFKMYSHNTTQILSTKEIINVKRKQGQGKPEEVRGELPTEERVRSTVETKTKSKKKGS